MQERENLQAINPEQIKDCPQNIRLDIAKYNISRSLASIQELCGLDDAVIVLLLESYINKLRENLCMAAAMQYAQVTLAKEGEDKPKE